MIAFLEGILVEKLPTGIVMNVGGVGYGVRIPLSSYDRLPAVDTTCRILTYDHVREDEHLLFGFMTEAERKMFSLLLGVSGIGPKLAIGMLSGLSVKEIAAAIAAGDVKRLSSVSGIGRKTAERIVVDLRDKVSAGEALEAATAGRGLTETEMRARDAVLALISLGYKRAEAELMVRKVLTDALAQDGVEAIVKKVLSG